MSQLWTVAFKFIGAISSVRKRLLKHSKLLIDYFSSQFIIWAFVGLVTILIDWILFLLGHSLFSSVLIANFISVFSSSVFNFLMHRYKTFQKTSNMKKEALKYCIYQFLIWFLGAKLIVFLINLDINLELAKILPLIVIAPINFFTLKYWIYR